jgi:hypothetical protein
MTDSESYFSDLDLLPWAAYVTGHHPDSIRFAEEEIWDHYFSKNMGEPPDVCEKLSVDLDELEEAVALLLTSGDSSSIDLLNFHLALGFLKVVCMEVVESPLTVEPWTREAPGDSAWLDLRAVRERLINPKSELHPWNQLGVAIGSCEYELGARPPLDEESIPKALSSLPEVVKHFPQDDRATVHCLVEASLMKVRQSWSSTGFWMHSLTRYKMFTELDRELRVVLKTRQKPMPLLVLDNESVTFLDQRRPLSAFPQTEMGCLWVLAERAGKPVPRPEIIAEGRLQTDPYNLKWVIIRLEKLLKQLAQEAAQQRMDASGGLTEFDFIKGARGKGNRRGPYCLNLPPDRVVVRGPGPSWMKAATSP